MKLQRPQILEGDRDLIMVFSHSINAGSMAAGHSNPTLCKRICFELLAFIVSGNAKNNAVSI